MAVWPEERLREHVEAAGGRARVDAGALLHAFSVRQPTEQAGQNVRQWLENVGVTMEPPVLPPDGEVTLSVADQGPGPGASAPVSAVSLEELEATRRASVLAYCSRMCDPTRIAEAADAAFAGLRAALEAADEGAVVDLDRLLVEATRDAAAQRAAAIEPPTTVARLVARRSQATCDLMPTLLAARASGRLGSADVERVERHLSRCARCRELEHGRQEAERAYAALLGEPAPKLDDLARPPLVAEPFAPDDGDPEIAAAGPLDGDAEGEATDLFDIEWTEPEPVGEVEAEVEARDAVVEAEEEVAVEEPEALVPPEPEPETEPDPVPELDTQPEPEPLVAAVAAPPPEPVAPVVAAPPPEPPAAPARRAEGSPWTRRIAIAVFVVGALLATDALLTVTWKEPVSAFMQARQQNELEDELNAAERDDAPVLSADEEAAIRHIRSEPERREKRLSAYADSFARKARDGHAVGRLRVEGMGEWVVVQGTNDADLRKAPGHYGPTAMPGQRGTVAVAGHRTTYGAPFRKLDDLKARDQITFTMPYGRFTYEVQGRKIVPAGSTDATKRVSYNRLVLTACHPLYSAKQRILVFARLTKKEPLGRAAADPRVRGGKAPTGSPREVAMQRTRARLKALGKRLLGPGMKGKDVKALQRLLGVPQTGVYDPLTAFAVKDFQQKHGLGADGRAGAATKRKLARRPRPPTTPPTPPPVAPVPPKDANHDGRPDQPGQQGQGPQGQQGQQGQPGAPGQGGRQYPGQGQSTRPNNGAYGPPASGNP